MSKRYYIPMRVLRWDSLECSFLGMNTVIKAPEGSRSVGFIQVFETRGDAEEAYPGTEIVEMQEVSE